MSSFVLERVGRGERDAVPECLDRYGGLVWALARKYDPVNAEDAAQEVFIDLWRNASRFDPEIAAEATFVAMIARRRLVDRLRKRGRTVPTTPLPETVYLTSVEGESRLAVADEVARVRGRLNDLRPEQRTVLELIFDKGLTHNDVSTALGMPLGTVKAHARRGLLRLRELVAGNESLEKGEVR